ncbi:serine/threonine-protein kinase [Urbifossiella limnaea]|uniref:Serine/threonine-protein kinase PknB n=1 Tax=Urbifossiella limnaea TaxID=2528023 RepID=A0A517XV10_9BACT|nr:serine/threonine-protein kinase [Urbifossiella limnaea]QDU21324.1 Serine/threonine-protein kinase PknB [Urbifossiella limnaea]
MSTPNPLDTIFSGAIELTSAADRVAYIARACGEDRALRLKVERLVAAYFRAGGFLEDQPPGLETTVGTGAIDGPGTVIGPYRLIEPVGEGGMGVVFVAEQRHPIRRKVALKVIKPGMDTREVVARFEAERQALALMDHPHIAKVLDGGVTDQGRPYFVMELVRGTPVTEYCDQARLGLRERLELFVQVCQAVQHAHQKGVIHRDIKPSNVLVAGSDGAPTAKVIDFGVAKAVGQQLTDKTVYTRFQQLVGSPLYMSPEQAGLSGLDVDTRSDIYSLGVLLYELLTGTTPFDKERFRTAAYDELRQIIREEEPPRPSTRLSTLGPAAGTVSANRGVEPRRLFTLVRGELDWLVMKALEKDRNRRYETANGLAMDVQRYLAGEAVLAVPPSVGYRVRKFARRNKQALAGASLLVVMFLVLVGGFAWVASDRAAQRVRTASEVAVFLQRADTLYADNKLPEAVAEVQKARGVLGAGGGDEGLRRRVEQRLVELTSAARLEEILIDSAALGLRDQGYAEYARVFQASGIDVGALPPEAAAARVAESNIKLDLVLALDRWASALRTDPRKLDPARWQQLQAISRAAGPDPWRMRYNAAAEAGDLRALRELAAEADPTRLRTRVLAALGDSLRSAGDVEASVEFLRAAQRRHPTDYSINASLGWSLRSLKSPAWDDAIAFRRIAVAVRPHSPTANWYLGHALHTVGKLDEAMAYYQTVVELDPDHAPAHFSLANILRLRGRCGQAIVHFRRSAELLPADPNPLNGLAWELATCVETTHRDPAQAVDLARQVVALSVKQHDDRDKSGRDRLGNYWNTLGVAHYYAGNPDEAVVALHTSLRLASCDDERYVCEDWFFLAMASWKLGRTEAAREWYDRAAGWMVKKKPREEEIQRFRAEAAALLGVEVKE